MPGKPPGEIVLGVIRLLEENGQMTMHEIADALGKTRFEVSSVVSRMSKKQKLVPKRLYITRYVYVDDTNNRYYPRAVYALGNHSNAVKPKPDNAANRKRYRERRKLQVNSVWQFAQPRRVREAQRRTKNASVSQ